MPLPLLATVVLLLQVVIGSDKAEPMTAPATGTSARPAVERIETFTTLLRDGTLFYVPTIAPRSGFSDYTDTFRRVMESIQIVDCDRCVPR
jgi:hypothetical protein